MARLGDVATYINGFAFKPTDWSENGLPIIRIQDLTGTSYQTNRFNGKYHPKYEINNGDVLISWSASLGVYIWKGEKAVLNQHIFKVIFDKTEINKSFFVHQVQNILENAASEAHGATMKHLTKPVFDALPFYLPDVDTQKAIAEILDNVSNLISLHKQQLTKLDELVKARFVELFGEVENLIHSWDVKRFAEVTINFDSTRKPVKDADRQKMQGQYPYYGATGIVDHVNDYRIDGTFLLISEDGKALEFRNKDIAFIASGKIWVNNHAHVLQCTEDIEMIFLMYYMNFRNISDWVTGIDQKKLNRANMDKIPIGLPPIELQKQFAAFVEQTDKSKSAIQKSLDKLEILKKSLMQKYFG